MYVQNGYCPQQTTAYTSLIPEFIELAEGILRSVYEKSCSCPEY